MHKSSEKIIAMKVPANNQKSTHARIMAEIRNLAIVGDHEHILEMLAYVPDFPSLGPVIFFPVCDLGNLYMYTKEWCIHEFENHRLQQVSELTVWKLFHDMALALDHLHNNLGTCYVHQDLKPNNILVQTPAGYREGHGTPVEPIFLICDFARMTAYPALPSEVAQPWFGTPEFAPPLAEQNEPIHPSGDIWTLGTTIQNFALSINPQQSRRSFIAERKARGEAYPHIEDHTTWREGVWRRKIPTIYRPLDISKEELVQNHDARGLFSTYQPFSAKLNDWYKKLFEPDRKSRVTSAELVKNFVPLANMRMVELRNEQRASGRRNI